MIPVYEANNLTGPARREKGEIHMFTRTRIRNAAWLVVILALFTACGGVSGGDYTINAGNWPGEWPWFWPEKADFIVDGSFSDSVPVAGHSSIRLDAVNGEIKITGQPGATSVIVTAELQVGSNASRLDAEAGLTQLGVLVADGADEIFVQTVQPNTMDGRQYVVNYTITVPSDIAVDVTQVNGHVNVLNIESSLFVEVVNGNVYLSDIFGVATVDVDNGSIDGTVTLSPGGEIILSTGIGDIDLRVPKSTSADLTAHADFGAITWDNLDLLNPVDTNQSLTGTLGDGAGLIDLETWNGNIDVTGFNG
jgi:DUF4097 and DUF4098 domain-containing protein YvlB